MSGLFQAEIACFVVQCTLHSLDLYPLRKSQHYPEMKSYKYCKRRSRNVSFKSEKRNIDGCERIYRIKDLDKFGNLSWKRKLDT